MKISKKFLISFSIVFISLFIAFTASAAQPLSAPQVTASNVASTGKIRISWDAVDGATEYRIYRSTERNGSYKNVYTTTGTSYVNTSATTGTRYFYKVMAAGASADANSDFSAVVSRICDLPQPKLTVSNVASTGKIKISWNAVEGAEKYEVWRSLTGKSGSYKRISTTTKTTVTNTTDVVAGTKYYYKIRAVHANSAANSAFASVSRTCDLPQPKLTVSNVASTGKIKISWNAVEGAEKYEVWRSLTGKSGSYKRISTTTNTTVTNTTDVVAGTRYYYKIRAVHTSSAANSAFASVSRLGDLPQPKLTVSNVASTGKIKISWDAVDGAEKYEVWRSVTGKSGSYKRISTTTKTTVTNTTDVVAGTRYYYKIRAVHANSAANSAFASVSRLGDLPAPKATATLTSNGKPCIEWNAVDGAKEYVVYRATSPDGSYSAVLTTTGTKYTNTSATAGKTYYYKVKAVHTNSSANSAYSSVVTATCRLAAPEISISLSSGKPVIKWNAVSGATKYQVYRATSKSGSYSLLTTTTGTKATDTKLEANKTYYYKVRALHTNSSANSTYSDILSASTGPSANDVFVERYIYSTYTVLYKKPDVNSDALLLKYRDKVNVGADFATYDHGRWVTVMYNGKVYYNWIETGIERFTDEKPFTYINSSNTQMQNDVLELALKYTQLPTSYRHDESTGELNEIGTYGFDCSGFAGYVLNTVMSQHNPLYKVTKNITGLYETQTIYNNGFANQFDVQDIALKDIKPGDIVFFDVYDDSRVVDHCGIYIGNNEFVHSTSFHDGVLISPLRDEYLDNFRGVRRYFPYTFKPANQTIKTNYQYVYMYSEKNSDSEKIYTFDKNLEEATLLYTSDTGNWGYVKNKNGLEGYVLMKRFDLVR